MIFKSFDFTDIYPLPTLLHTYNIWIKKKIIFNSIFPNDKRTAATFNSRRLISDTSNLHNHERTRFKKPFDIFANRDLLLLNYI